MRSLRLMCSYALPVAVFCSPVVVRAEATFQAIEPPPGCCTYAEAISPEGSVVVGYSECTTGQSCPSGGGYPQAFRWMEPDGLVPLGDLPGGEVSSRALAVSDYGQVIVGWGTGPTLQEAVAWYNGNGPHSLSLDPRPSGSFALGVSQDGVILARCCADTRWCRIGVSGTQCMGTARAATGGAISGDGEIVAGAGWDGSCMQIVRWTGGLQSTMEGMSRCKDGAPYAANYDGTVVVGELFDVGAWRGKGTGGGEIIGPGVAHDVSGDGATVVGNSFLWTTDSGYRDLQQALETEYCLDLSDWDSLVAKGISADGFTVVGRGYRRSASSTQGWIARLTPAPALITVDPPSGTIDVRQDYSSTGATRQGIDSVRIRFSTPVRSPATGGPLDVDSFIAYTSDGSIVPVVGVVEIPDTPNTFDVLFEDPIPPGTWTTVEPTVERADGVPFDPLPCARVTIGFLPGDVNGDGRSNARDILALIDSLNGVPGRVRPLTSTDINRSGAANAQDITRLIDLFNGVNTTRPWFNATLPPRP